MMKYFTLITLLLAGNFLFSQQNKVTLTNSENLLKKIVPNGSLDFWTLVYNVAEKDHVIKSTGNGKFPPKFEGFKIYPHDEGFYYIVYAKGGQTSYITDLDALVKFIGSVDNGEEAAVAALAKGYLIDFEFKDYAANYTDHGTFYTVDAGKVTSRDCPLSKTHYSMTVDKKTGEIRDEKALGPYFELYGKQCKNNPHYNALDKQIEEAKLKAEEQKKIQKEITMKMEKRLRKLQRKN